MLFIRAKLLLLRYAACLIRHELRIDVAFLPLLMLLRAMMLPLFC